MKEIKFARQCSCCKKGMNDGYVINGGEEYYCTNECLHTKYNSFDIEFMDMGEDNSDNYWTEWICNEDMEWIKLDGELVYIGE
jgi:hypothetical protein